MLLDKAGKGIHALWGLAISDQSDCLMAVNIAHVYMGGLRLALTIPISLPSSTFHPSTSTRRQADIDSFPIVSMPGHICVNQRARASVSLRFLIVGGSIAGLACAYALQTAGHHVIVLEKQDRKSRVSHLSEFFENANSYLRRKRLAVVSLRLQT